jgi:hypothetical protein
VAKTWDDHLQNFHDAAISARWKYKESSSQDNTYFWLTRKDLEKVVLNKGVATCWSWRALLLCESRECNPRKRPKQRKSGREKPVTLVINYGMVGETGYSSVKSLSWSWRRSAIQVWRLAYIICLGTDSTWKKKWEKRQRHFSWFCSKFKDSLDRML